MDPRVRWEVENVLLEFFTDKLDENLNECIKTNDIVNAKRIIEYMPLDLNLWGHGELEDAINLSMRFDRLEIFMLLVNKYKGDIGRLEDFYGYTIHHSTQGTF